MAQALVRLPAENSQLHGAWGRLFLSLPEGLLDRVLPTRESVVTKSLDMKAMRKQPTWSWRPAREPPQTGRLGRKEAGLTCPSQIGRTCRKAIWCWMKERMDRSVLTCCASAAQCWLTKLHLFKVLLSSNPGKQEVGLGTSNLGHSEREGVLEKPPNKSRILRIYLERWMGSWRMKSRYLLTPEDSSLTVSRSSSTSVAGAQPDLDTLVFSENSLFISEIHWSELFHCTSRGKPGKGAHLGHLWDESKPTQGQVLSLSTFGLPWWLSQ